jgi:hypothetical protein
MRKFLSILALSMLFAACQNEHKQDAANSTPVDIRLSVATMDITTQNESLTEGYSSALGAIDNFSDSDWAKYDLRYTFEVYAAGDNGSGTPIAETRQVKTINRYNPEKEVYFNVSLKPNKTYKFVVFADFVNEGKSEDLYYNVSDLRDITAIDGKLSPMDEARDAYFATEEIAITTHLEKSIYLKRPFGKLRVVTTDYEYIKSYADPAKAKVTYYNCEVFKSLNAVNGKISTARTEDELTFEYDLAKSSRYTAGVDAESDKMTLFADYLLAPRSGQDEVNFTLAVWDANGKEINVRDFNLPIPIERNHLTTIIGNMLTSKVDIKIDVNHELQEGETI